VPCLQPWGVILLLPVRQVLVVAVQHMFLHMPCPPTPLEILGIHHRQWGTLTTYLGTLRLLTVVPPLLLLLQLLGLVWLVVMVLTLVVVLVVVAVVVAVVVRQLDQLAYGWCTPTYRGHMVIHLIFLSGGRCSNRRKTTLHFAYPSCRRKNIG
jgi:hypothetical protein